MYFPEEFGPKHVLKHFKNICDIPHTSFHEAALCQYIKDFAAEHGHEYYEDETGNLIVYVKASPGCENAPAFLLQAHMDMVDEKEDWSDHNFLTDPIELRIVDGHYVYANGTTLGADNAVGMMNMLALMEDDTVVHPPLEMLFTMCEENGMVGIRKVDYSKINARRMINMDCGDPDVMCVSTAGAANCLLKLPTVKIPVEGRLMQVSISGLMGGHAGLKIDCGRLSAIYAMGRVLCTLAKEVPFNVVYTKSDRLNGLATHMDAIIAVKEENVQDVIGKIASIEKDIYEEYCDPEKDLCIKATEYAGAEYTEMLDEKTTNALIRMIYLMPFGVIKRDWKEKDTILCSNNTMEVTFKDDAIEAEMMVRAPGDKVKEDLLVSIEILCYLLGIELEILDQYSGWPFRKDSEMQRLCHETFTELTGKKLKVEKHNSCAETGIVLGAIPDMDIVALAPYGKDAHTTNEHMDLATVQPFWDFLVLLLKKMCE